MQLTVLILSMLLFTSSLAYSSEFTVTIEAGKEDCFYTTATRNVYLEVDYQVIYKLQNSKL